MAYFCLNLVAMVAPQLSLHSGNVNLDVRGTSGGRINFAKTPIVFSIEEWRHAVRHGHGIGGGATLRPSSAKRG